MDDTNQYDIDIPNDLFSTMDREKNERSHSIDFEVVKDDITRRNVDAIVNAAHDDLTGGGGVDGAIHKAAGQKLLGECLSLYGCPEGEARITNGYDLPAKYIIHTVGPVWTPNKEDHQKAKETLVKCYINCLDIAETQGLKSIAFPCISTGAYCFPKELAAQLATHTIYEWFHHLFLRQRVGEKVGCYLDIVEIVCFSDEDVEIYRQAIEYEEKSRDLPKCNRPDGAICSNMSGQGLCRKHGDCWMDQMDEMKEENNELK